MLGGGTGLLYSGFRSLRHSASPANVVVGSALGMMSTALYTALQHTVEHLSPWGLPMALSATFSGAAAGSIMALAISRDAALRHGLLARGFVIGSILGGLHSFISPYLEYDSAQRRIRTALKIRPDQELELREMGRELGVEDADRPWIQDLIKRHPWLPVSYTEHGESWVYASNNPSRDLYVMDERSVKWLPNEGPRPSHIEPFFRPEEERWLQEHLGADWWTQVQPVMFPETLLNDVVDPMLAEKQAQLAAQRKDAPVLSLLQTMFQGSAELAEEELDAPATRVARKHSRLSEKQTQDDQLRRLSAAFSESGALLTQTTPTAAERGASAPDVNDVERRWRHLSGLVAMPDLPPLKGKGIFR